MKLSEWIILLALLIAFSGSARAQDDGVCARVRVRLSQEVTLTRTAFQATLEITNSGSISPLTNMKVALDVRDINKQDSAGLFGIPAPVLTGIGDVSGTGILVSGATASIVWTLTPTRDAAPMTAADYFVGGQVEYTQDGQKVLLPLSPALIHVVPDPLLQFHYFWQRDVYSDDPFTPDIEPSEPFALGLLIVNKGYGTAHNLQITSSQPQIVDNEKGLLIAFKLIGTQVNTQPVLPSLRVNFGDILPQDTATATFFLTSTLQGKFMDYTASFKHVDDLGSPRTSLIDSVDIHELEHVVRIDNPVDDGKPDFLVNDIADPNLLPDTVWSSDGTTSRVTARVDAQTDGPVSDGHLTVHLALSNAPSGYVYMRTNDPAKGKYQLLRVIRSDGREIRVGDNAWTTDRTIRLVGHPPDRQQRLYVFDRDTTGYYTLIYGQLAPANTTPGGGKKLGDGAQVILDSVVLTAKFFDSFYVEAQDRSSGLKVVYSTPQDTLREGATLRVAGTMRTDANGERYVEASQVDVNGTLGLEPLGLATRHYFTGDYAYDPDTGAGQKGMTGGSGLTTVGLLTRTLGKVTAATGSTILLDDGYGNGVKVTLPSGVSTPALGDVIGVTGIASMELSGGKTIPVLKPRRKQDVFTDTASFAQTFQSPPGQLAPGVNLFALPGVPLDPTPPKVLTNFDPGDGSGLSGRLSRFDTAIQDTIFYNKDKPSAFGNLLNGDGYILQTNRGENQSIMFNGYRVNFADRWLSLPKIGLTQLGNPLAFSVKWKDLLVTDGTKTLTLEDGAKDTPLWVNSQAQYYDPFAQMYKILGLPDENPDSILFTPWYGYLVTTSRDKLALIVPLAVTKVTLDALDPASIIAGNPAFILTATGTGFTADSQLYWNGSLRVTEYVSPTKLRATIPASDVAAAGTASLMVANGGFGAVSNVASFTINNPMPSLVSLSTSSIKAGSKGFAITITGSGFVQSSVATWNNVVHPTTYLSPLQISFTVSDADLAYGGTASVQVSNPTPGGGQSNGLLFTIDAFAQDVSSKIKVTLGGYRLNRATGRYVQTVTLTNISNNAITGPISLTLDKLSAGISLYNKTGVTNVVTPANSPYINATLSGNTLNPGGTTTLTLEFTDPANAAITYSTRVLAGSGSR